MKHVCALWHVSMKKVPHHWDKCNVRLACVALGLSENNEKHHM